jgi:hypothetical protein
MTTKQYHFNVFREISGSHGGEYEVFWDVEPCSHVELTDVSEVHTSFIIRAMNESS